MKKEQKELLEHLFQTTKEADDIFSKQMSYSSHYNQKRGWVVYFFEEPIENNPIERYILFTFIAQFIQICDSIFSSSEELLTYDIEITKLKTGEPAIQYFLF